MTNNPLPGSVIINRPPPNVAIRFVIGNTAFNPETSTEVPITPETVTPTFNTELKQSKKRIMKPKVDTSGDSDSIDTPDSTEDEVEDEDVELSDGSSKASKRKRKGKVDPLYKPPPGLECLDTPTSRKTTRVRKKRCYRDGEDSSTSSDEDDEMKQKSSTSAVKSPKPLENTDVRKDSSERKTSTPIVKVELLSSSNDADVQGFDTIESIKNERPEPAKEASITKNKDTNSRSYEKESDKTTGESKTAESILLVEPPEVVDISSNDAKTTKPNSGGVDDKVPPSFGKIKLVDTQKLLPPIPLSNSNTFVLVPCGPAESGESLLKSSSRNIQNGQISKLTPILPKGSCPPLQIQSSGVRTIFTTTPVFQTVSDMSSQPQITLGNISGETGTQNVTIAPTQSQNVNRYLGAEHNPVSKQVSTPYRRVNVNASTIKKAKYEQLNRLTKHGVLLAQSLPIRSLRKRKWTGNWLKDKYADCDVLHDVILSVEKQMDRLKANSNQQPVATVEEDTWQPRVIQVASLTPNPPKWQPKLSGVRTLTREVPLTESVVVPTMNIDLSSLNEEN